MKTIKILIVMLIFILSGIGYLNLRIRALNSISIEQPKPCVPTFPDGDGPYYVPDVPEREKLSPATASGVILAVSGRVLQRDCRTPVVGAVLDIWHADEHGSYTRDWYRGKITTGINGSYRFTTVMPKGYGEGTGYRPPHIHFKVWSGGNLLITSEMFFPEVRGTSGFEDAYIMSLKDKGFGLWKHLEGYHDIILP